MNRAGGSGPLVNELISKLTLTEQASAAFAKLRERCDAILKDSSTWGRTDPFAVQKHLDGLQEKFRIFNKDDFADALANRLLELDNQRSPYAPEFLSLLLQLSDRPVDVSKIPTSEKASDTAPLSVEFSCVGVDDAGSAFANEDIWAEVDYVAASSDSESSIVSSEISIPKLLPQRPQPSHDEFMIPEEFLSSGADDELIATIKSGHFWEYDSAAVRKFSESHTRFITELQAAREILFMLQGLPTSLFWQIDGSIAVDRRYAFTHISNPAFLHMLRAVADIGVRLGKLRKFTQMPQSAVFLQTFVRGIEKELALFDAFLSRKQRSYLSIGDLVTVSLLQLTEEVQAETRVLMLLADLVTELASAPPEHSFLCLDLLYDLVCDKQSSGHTHEYKSLAKLFFSCFDAYAQPLRLWLSSGDLGDLHKRDQFFIVDRGHDRGLSTLWQEWYVLKETNGRLHAPKFIKPSARKILTTGKSMVFLRNLKFPISEFDSTSAYRKFNFSFEDLDDASCQLLPFPILLDQAVEDLISTNYILASRTLRDQLRETCALWPTLSALHYIYLCRDGSISATIDRKIFESLDNGNEFWRDRFLLTELVEIAFSETVSVDTSRILVRPSGDKLENMGSGRSQELGILGSISIEYVVPWPVANIVGKSAISIYQRISAFLMQIRRTKSVLERQKFPRADTKYTDTGEDDDRLSYTLRLHLLWFTNTLYGHLTEMVIATNVAAMEKSLAESPDIDSMIFVYRRFMSALEGQSLLSPKLQPIHRAIIDLLELCVHFADIQAARHEDTNKFNQLHRGPTVINRRNQHLRKKRLYHNGPRLEVDASDDDDSFDHGDQNSEDDDTDQDDYDEGNTTSISFIELSYSQRLKSLKEDFHQSLAFVIAGLRSVERVDEQQNWDVLADRLSWSTRSE